MEDKTGWFHIELNGREYYTPFSGSKNTKHVAGPGDRMPTPKEVVDKLEELGEGSFVEDSRYYLINPREKLKAGNEGGLPAGIYDYKTGGSGTPERLIPKTIRSDGFIKTDKYRQVAEYLHSFLGGEVNYRETNSLYKTGVLMYGSPAGGKTSCIRTIVSEDIPKDSIVIFTNEIPSNEFLKIMKLTLPDVFKVFVFEEMLTVVNENRSIERVLDFLDGELSLDKTIYLATTNYPERLPMNVVDRHGRFDELYKFDTLKGDDLKNLVTHYLRREPSKEEVAACEGSSTASIQQACIRSRFKNGSLVDIMKDFKKRHELVTKEFSEAKKIGISSDRSSGYPFYHSDDE
jgi:ATPase family associated with various cellular activities (AAA)